jgi:hypothetical protein
VTRTLTLDKLKDQLKVIDAKLVEYQKYAVERLHLLELIAAWEKAFPEERNTDQSFQPIVPPQPAKTERTRKTTEDYVHEVLSENGPLHPNQLLRYMQKTAWISKGNDRKDADRIYQAMRRNPAKFQRMTDGRWTALR